MAGTLSHCLDFDHAIKLSLMGESSSGKSCLMERWTQNAYRGHRGAGTFGVDFSQRVVQVGEELVKARVWDASGLPTQRKFFTPFYKRSQGILLVYDVTRADSLTKLSDWVHTVVPATSPSATLMLVGCKADLEEQRQVSQADARAFCEKHGVRLMSEVSSATGANVDAAFSMLLTRIQHEHGERSDGGSGEIPQGSIQVLDMDSASAMPVSVGLPHLSYSQLCCACTVQ